MAALTWISKVPIDSTFDVEIEYKVVWASAFRELLDIGTRYLDTKNLNWIADPSSCAQLSLIIGTHSLSTAHRDEITVSHPSLAQTSLAQKPE